MVGGFQGVGQAYSMPSRLRAGAGLNRAGVFSLTGTIRIVDTSTRAFTPSSAAVNRPNTRPRFLWGFLGICSRSARNENPPVFRWVTSLRNSTDS